MRAGEDSRQGYEGNYPSLEIPKQGRRRITVTECDKLSSTGNKVSDMQGIKGRSQMKALRLFIAVVLLMAMVSVGLCDQKTDKAMLELRAQALAERILRLETENKLLVQEHQKAVREFEAILKVLERMKDGKQS